jgi:hypothetical protein
VRDQVVRGTWVIPETLLMNDYSEYSSLAIETSWQLHT